MFCFRRGVELDPSCNDAKLVALTLLTIGQLDEGWEFYEAFVSIYLKVSPFLKYLFGMDLQSIPLTHLGRAGIR